MSREILVESEEVSAVPAEHHGTSLPAQATEQDISSLVRLAIDKDVGVEVVERLVGLQERIADRNARAAYFEALAAFQDECPEIAKSKTAEVTSQRTGGKFSYSYAPLDVIARTIRPLLRRHNLSYSFDVSLANGALMVACIVRHIDGHSERASFPVPVEKGGRMSDAQAAGSALTYGKRQALVSALGISVADIDTDGRKRDEFGDEEKKPISNEQIAVLDDLIEAGSVNRARFLEWLGYGRLSDIPQFDFQRAKNALLEKQKR